MFWSAARYCRLSAGVELQRNGIKAHWAGRLGHVRAVDVSYGPTTSTVVDIRSSSDMRASNCVRPNDSINRLENADCPGLMRSMAARPSVVGITGHGKSVSHSISAAASLKTRPTAPTTSDMQKQRENPSCHQHNLVRLRLLPSDSSKVLRADSLQRQRALPSSGSP